MFKNFAGACCFSGSQVRVPLIRICRMIKKLPDCIISRISAGEVITSPRNVLKELIENSIDAGATRISVVLSSTLLSLSVSDNGSGVQKDDLEVMCQNHSTSKIATLDDLRRCGVISALCSFGFRGEALHSISVSSRLSVTTKTQDGLFGYRAAYSGAEVLSMAKVAQEDAGTLVEVEDIFYRNKIRKDHFYKNKAECMACIDLVKSYACIYSGMEMRVDDKVILQRDHSHRKLAVSPAEGGGQPGCEGADRGSILAPYNDAAILNKVRHVRRVFLGAEYGETGLEVERSERFLIICSNRLLTLKKCRCIFFVNNRLVRNGSLKKRILDKYRSFIREGAHPFVYVEIFVSSVDVNVHPSKSEVLVADEQVFDAVVRAVEKRLSSDAQYIPSLQTGGVQHGTDASESGAAAHLSPRGPGGCGSSSLQPSGSQVFHENDIKVYSSSQVRTIEESGGRRKAAGRAFSLVSLRTLRSEAVEVDSSFFRALVYVGCTDHVIFVQSHTMLIGIQRRPFLGECFYMVLLREFGNLESRSIPPFKTGIDEGLHPMLHDYFGIRIDGGHIVEAPVLCGACADDWSGFDVQKTTEYETIKSTMRAISAVYQNTELDTKRFNLIRDGVVGTRSLIECCRILIALKDLYRKFGRC